MVIIKKQPRGKFFNRFVPTFELSQSIYDSKMMEALHTYLGVGRLVINRERVSIVVTSLKDIVTVILPHFEKYPLMGGKFVTYLLFRKVIIAMYDNYHLTAKGFLDILNLCYFMNNTSTRSPESLKLIVDTIMSSSSEFASANSFPSQANTLILDFSQKISKSITLEYLAGLIDGDGSFGFNFSTTSSRVTSFFQVTQSNDDYGVLVTLMDYFGCGEVKKYPNKDACVYRIYSYKNLLEKIKPLLLSIHLNTVKQFYVEPTLKAWDIISKNRFKSSANLEKIVNLVYDMNRGGLKRKVDKATFMRRVRKLNEFYGIIINKLFNSVVII